MASGWFWRKKSTQKLLVDGSEIEKLAEDNEAFSNFIEHKFDELDRYRDGKLSVHELKPVVADIGAALGFPAVGSSPDSDHVYTEVLGEFIHGKEKEVSKSEFKEVLSDILMGVAAGLKRDPIVILRIDGRDLKEFVESGRFEAETLGIFSGFESGGVNLRDCLTSGLGQITAKNGMPPASDSWVSSNVVEPALQSFSTDVLESAASKETFLEHFKMLICGIVKILQQRPVIVAHSENIFNGSGIRRLLANKFELDKLLNEIWTDLPKDSHHKASTEYLHIALDKIAASADLPPFGAVAEVDEIVNKASKKVTAGEMMFVNEEDFQKLLKEILGCIMLQLEGNPIFVSSNSVIHETLNSSSNLLPPYASMPPIS